VQFVFDCYCLVISGEGVGHRVGFKFEVQLGVQGPGPRAQGPEPRVEGLEFRV
jgi:hypothetical protein